MDEKIRAALSRKEPTDFHQRILEHCRKLVSFSQSHMSKLYTDWDKADQVFRGVRSVDEDDRKAQSRKEPIKLVVPMTHKQVMTFVAFGYNVLTQRRTIFELGGPDVRAALIGESLLERDLNHSNFRGHVLYQWLLDLGRFGLGILKHSWVHNTKKFQEVQKALVQTPGKTTPDEVSEIVDVVRTTFLGNKVENVDPYRFYPDVRLPLTKFQEGEFCAADYEFTEARLKQMEADGLVAGTEHIPEIGAEFARTRRVQAGTAGTVDIQTSAAKLKGIRLVTEVLVRLVPSEFMLDEETPLGPEEHPVMYVVWFVNDKRVIRCEPANLSHDDFPYDLTQYSNDQRQFLNEGISSLLDPLQDTISWLINSHITSVRKVIDNKLIVDPSGVEMQDLKDRNPVVKLKPQAYRTGVDRWVRQIDVNDVTQKHIEDANTLSGVAQQTTGISENLMGQFAPGRRSAEEAATVNQAAAGRVLMVLRCAWWSCLVPMGMKMLDNLRHGLDQTTLIKVAGVDNLIDPYTGQPYPGVQKYMQVSMADLADEYDFEVFDSTLPSEKAHSAQAYQELLLGMLSNPVAMLMTGFDPRQLINDMLRLRGVRDAERLMFPKPVRDQLFNIAMINLLGGGGGEQPSDAGGGQSAARPPG